MTETQELSIYEMSINILVSWQAHNLSTAGSNGTNRVMARKQLLADGTETDACSGNIAKHYHAAVTAEYFDAAGCLLCPACRVGDSRRIAALQDHPEYRDISFEQILKQCALCDTHGFLITAKNAESDDKKGARQKMRKDTLIDYSYALARPDRHRETTQLHIRSGSSKEDGQMLMRMPSRSGEYALCVRYRCVGIGADTERWILAVTDQEERTKRHRANLHTLRDTLVSPDGAMTATMLPHLTGLMGAIMVRSTVGRAPLYSALDANFVARLSSMTDETCHVYPFETVDGFYTLMNTFIRSSVPALRRSWKQEPKNEADEGRRDGVRQEEARG